MCHPPILTRHPLTPPTAHLTHHLILHWQATLAPLPTSPHALLTDCREEYSSAVESDSSDDEQSDSRDDDSSGNEENEKRPGSGGSEPLHAYVDDDESGGESED